MLWWNILLKPFSFSSAAFQGITIFWIFQVFGASKFSSSWNLLSVSWYLFLDVEWSQSTNLFFHIFDYYVKQLFTKKANNSMVFNEMNILKCIRINSIINFLFKCPLSISNALIDLFNKFFGSWKVKHLAWRALAGKEISCSISIIDAKSWAAIPECFVSPEKYLYNADKHIIQ